MLWGSNVTYSDTKLSIVSENVIKDTIAELEADAEEQKEQIQNPRSHLLPGDKTITNEKSCKLDTDSNEGENFNCFHRHNLSRRENERVVSEIVSGIISKSMRVTEEKSQEVADIGMYSVALPSILSATHGFVCRGMFERA